jgi:hypothetical protein
VGCSPQLIFRGKAAKKNRYVPERLWFAPGDAEFFWTLRGEANIGSYEAGLLFFDLVSS